jgi:stress-induced-phosphoprotein 1
LAEAHNDNARDFFKKGDFPSAIKEYTEAIRRAPNDPKYYNNKATCLLKLMDPYNAL